MFRSARAWTIVLALTTTALAGCVAPETPAATNSIPDVTPILEGVLNLTVEDVMTFTESIVTPAIGTATDLYEPTMEVSDTGTIYVAGHTIAAATTGTPAYFSNDDGQTWEPLPFFASLQSPPPVQGSQPPPGDEGFIVAGSNGQAWMADIYLAGFSITGWCGDGAEQCYDNRQAYDRAATLTAPCGAQASLNDRPWAAYANDTLLLVNNPGGGPMQIGVMKVPPALPVGIGGGMASVAGPEWNMCASPGGWIPGIPSMRDDLFFAVPQLAGGDSEIMTLTMGFASDIFAVETKEIFNVTSTGAGTSNGGRTAFDREGTLFVGAKNNTDAETDPGQFIIAVSTDDGKTFRHHTYAVGPSVQSLYLDGNMAGPGALLTWSQVGDTSGRADWYVAHVFVDENGYPTISNVTLAVDEGPPYSAHVTGAGVGPDGRAYFLTFEDADPVSYLGSTPVRVWIQQDGAKLPVTMVDASESSS